MQANAKYEDQFILGDNTQEPIKVSDGNTPIDTTSDAGEKRKVDDLALTLSKLSKKEVHLNTQADEKKDGNNITE
eukprot:1098073-Ditylum_brightwellii.AAC.1